MVYSVLFDICIYCVMVTAVKVINISIGAGIYLAAKIPTSHRECLDCQRSLLPLQTLEGSGDGSRDWMPATPLGDLDYIPSPWF